MTAAFTVFFLGYRNRTQVLSRAWLKLSAQSMLAVACGLLLPDTV